MRTKLSFTLLKSVLVSVRGSRGRSPRVQELQISNVSFNLVPDGLSYEFFSYMNQFLQYCFKINCSIDTCHFDMLSRILYIYIYFLNYHVHCTEDPRFTVCLRGKEICTVYRIAGISNLDYH